jgi:hypothetical protein
MCEALESCECACAAASSEAACIWVTGASASTVCVLRGLSSRSLWLRGLRRCRVAWISMMESDV